MRLRLIFLFITSISLSRSLSRKTKSIKYYEVIHPQQDGHGYSGAFSTRRLSAEHVNETTFHFSAFNRTFHIQLQKNTYLVSPNFQVTYQTKKSAKENGRGIESCYYQGQLIDDSNSSVAMTTCDGLRGLIRDGSGIEFIVDHLPSSVDVSDDDSPFDRSRIHFDSHIIYRRQDIFIETEGIHRCGTVVKESVFGESTSDSRTVWGDYKTPSSVQRRGLDILQKKVGGEDEEDKKKYIEAFIVVDNIQYKKYGREGVITRVVRIMNLVDSIYKLLNTRVVVVEVRVWDKKDKIKVDDYAYTNFKKYVYGTLFGKENIKADIVVLLMGFDFTGALYGVAGVGTMCTTSAAAVIQDYSETDEPGIANTIAHEVGHTLGFEHSDRCKCSGTCVMTSYTVTGYLANAWSECSRNKYKKGLMNGALTCLYDYPDKHIGDPKCGNGFVEKGEECDCGTEFECQKSGQHKCCNITTCKLQTTAHCADGPCCENCQPKSKGHECRRSYDSECDLPEFCSGNSTQCPTNFYVQDGTPCDDNTGVCYSGTCKSHNYQCRELWGPSAYSGKCYGLNVRGDRYANCGPIKKKGVESYLPCAEKDIYCGKLQCSGDIDWPLINRDGVSVKDHWYIGGKCSMCYIPRKSDEADPSMAMAGTKCRENSMCDDNRKCVNISSMKWIKKCSTKCLNGGVCNNNGNCHCPPKYACPNCEKPGLGGSLDSGQGCEIDNGLSVTVIVLLVLFLGVLPVVIVTALLVWKSTGRSGSVGIVHGETTHCESAPHLQRENHAPSSKPPFKLTKKAPPPPPQKRQAPLAPSASSLPQEDVNEVPKVDFFCKKGGNVTTFDSGVSPRN